MTIDTGEVTALAFHQDTFIRATIELPNAEHIVVQVEQFRETTPNSGTYASEGTEFSLISTSGTAPRTEIWKNVGVSWESGIRYKVVATIQTGYTDDEIDVAP